MAVKPIDLIASITSIQDHTGDTYRMQQQAAIVQNNQNKISEKISKEREEKVEKTTGSETEDITIKEKEERQKKERRFRYTISEKENNTDKEKKEGTKIDIIV